MIAAMEEIKQGNMNVKRASVQYGVQRTLQDRLSGRVQNGVKPGPRPYFKRGIRKRFSRFS